MRYTGALVACAITLGSGRAMVEGPPRDGQVAGVVYDSIGGVPLVGATVQLLPLDVSLQSIARRTVDTDAAGRFVLKGVPGGRYLVGFFHPKLDSLGVESPVTRIDVREGRDYALELAVPSSSSVIASWCGAGAAHDSSAGVHRFDARTGRCAGAQC